LNHKLSVLFVAIALVVSSSLNFYFYLAIRIQNENVTNNMMTRALASYGAQIDTTEYFLDEYLSTKNRSILKNEALWCAYGAELTADVCRQSSSEELYSQLWNTAHAVFSFASSVRQGLTVNETKLATTISALDKIWPFLSGFEMVNDMNPIEYIKQVNGANATATIIYYCQTAQDNLPKATY
jgi:hypothetical protein